MAPLNLDDVVAFCQQNDLADPLTNLSWVPENDHFSSLAVQMARQAKDPLDWMFRDEMIYLEFDELTLNQLYGDDIAGLDPTSDLPPMWAPWLIHHPTSTPPNN
ncbi:uncharacterized protein N7458_001712 [Penicillium daleae]|uniref:Uncharacterized protein n=1 Tax=Penicillium daleae TaxID=63821 RepID=A0AAD6CE04_9EURO|nr:uncharacterized protein N7458_001712 [Penicillium daleae]KAJ5460160.1 hypothetical protein N7458_001712 [Penicillium daleae]